MVNLRLNTKTSNPNPNVNFMAVLPGDRDDDAAHLLRALAAQVKPVMNTHGFEINSLEEYECNKVFLGRNWNNGETIELVLRRADGVFWSIPHLLSVFCHELAHIKHMNHRAEFHQLRIQLEKEVQVLRANGYFGDGLWSEGHRLRDGTKMFAAPLCADEVPEFICGGAQSRSRSTAMRRRRRATARVAGPSNLTGAQTAKRHKAGARIRSDTAFGGAGATGRIIGEDVQDERKKKEGAGFRKQAQSKKAREARAVAAEQRAHALQDATKPLSLSTSEFDQAGSGGGDNEDDVDSFEIVPETDMDRRVLVATDSDMDGSQENIFEQFSFPDEESSSNPTKTTKTTKPSIRALNAVPMKSPESLIHSETVQRRKELAGLPGQHKLGVPTNSSSKDAVGGKTEARPSKERPTFDLPSFQSWACEVCTLLNHADYALCPACGTRRATGDGD